MSIGRLRFVATTILVHEAAQRRGHARDYVAPFTTTRLPEQTHRRIPRAVLAIFEPAPIAWRWQQQPHRFPERADEMRRSRVDADHQVELRDHRSRIGKIVELRPQALNVRAWRN